MLATYIKIRRAQEYLFKTDKNLISIADTNLIEHSNLLKHGLICIKNIYKSDCSPKPLKEVV